MSVYEQGVKETDMATPGGGDSVFRRSEWAARLHRMDGWRTARVEEASTARGVTGLPTGSELRLASCGERNGHPHVLRCTYLTAFGSSTCHCERADRRVTTASSGGK